MALQFLKHFLSESIIGNNKKYPLNIYDKEKDDSWVHDCGKPAKTQVRTQRIMPMRLNSACIFKVATRIFLCLVAPRTNLFA